jgi:hypothetical protein
LDTHTSDPPGPWYVTLPPEARPYAGHHAGPFPSEADARAWLKSVPFIRGARVWRAAGQAPHSEVA